MTIEDPSELENVDREIRINELKHEVEELTGDEATTWESEDCPPEVAEQFWQNVVDFEKAPKTTTFDQLVEAGVTMPAPEELNDEELTAKLWQVIEHLARMRVFISQTDHLSDRELYAELWNDALREEVPDMPFDAHSSWHIDMLGSYSEDDILLQLKHYADEEERRQWKAEWPDYEMPDHEDPPYDRDRLLPKSETD